ncbi:hypothetical protein QBC46DRAFT_397392 [Diplogelasinospora grovesii]|uniref:Methyltransferase domain-containing protein n=1 Tax=Diplogelasinospora grovesii TaxID=303347 RepID=A0AAN6MXT5_9PEZI|nr:hypothetical protein QBC46DRAFT_397392 [Diplogelasinospora grovesii]
MGIVRVVVSRLRYVRNVCFNRSTPKQQTTTAPATETKSADIKSDTATADTMAVSDGTQQQEQQQKINTLLSCCLHDEKMDDRVYIPRYRHRLTIANAWSLKPGSRVLDIGCGQGESCLTLAMELGPEAHITGVDTADLEYGTPFNMRMSHEHVLASPLGKQITFHNVDAATLLQSLEARTDKPPFDAAVLCHSLWYFADQESVIELFKTLSRAGIPRVYVAEYAFSASLPSQEPHVLAARAAALLHAYQQQKARDDGSLDPEGGKLASNIRAAPDTKSIVAAAAAAGYAVGRQGTTIPGEDFLEGHFETRHVRGDRFAARVRDEKLSPEKEAEILAFQPQVVKKMDELAAQGIDKVRSMDVWFAELELPAQ